jgi:hypothetical protein
MQSQKLVVRTQKVREDHMEDSCHVQCFHLQGNFLAKGNFGLCKIAKQLGNLLRMLTAGKFVVAALSSAEAYMKFLVREK